MHLFGSMSVTIRVNVVFLVFPVYFFQINRSYYARRVDQDWDDFLPHLLS